MSEMITSFSNFPEEMITSFSDFPEEMITSFSDFPEEIIINILQFNNIYELNKWMRISRNLYSLTIQSRLLWEQYLHRDYNEGTIMNDTGVEYEIKTYKKCFQLNELIKTGILSGDIQNISQLWIALELYLACNNIPEIPPVLCSISSLQVL